MQRHGWRGFVRKQLTAALMSKRKKDDKTVKQSFTLGVLTKSRKNDKKSLMYDHRTAAQRVAINLTYSKALMS